MKYQGFVPGIYALLQKLPLQKGRAVLEIGVGLGSAAKKIQQAGGEYHGVDVACDVIDILQEQYPAMLWYCKDACSEEELGKQFDIVFSAHTLEHVEDPRAFFRFIRRHLKGKAFVAFPNETEEKHHGITWFESREDLFRAIEEAGLELVSIKQIHETRIHRVLVFLLWEVPKFFIHGSSKKKPQHFDETDAFAVLQSSGIWSSMLSWYAALATSVVGLFPVYRYEEAPESIKNTFLLLELK